MLDAVCSHAYHMTCVYSIDDVIYHYYHVLLPGAIVSF